MSVETIYVGLLYEGTDVWRPVSAERIDDGRYRILGPMPPDEQWQFGPEVIVAVAPRGFADGDVRLMAMSVPTTRAEDS